MSESKITDNEAFPDSVKVAMKTAYETERKGEGR